MFEDLQYLTGSTLTSRLDAYTGLGLRYARFQLIWANVQYVDAAHYDWTHYDVLVRELLARGLRPLPVVGTTPAWARDAGCREETCAPADAAAFARFAAAAAARYAPLGVHEWELWNEPNSAVFFKPAPDAARYADLLVRAHDAIEAVDPAATIITGGTAPAADLTVDGVVRAIAPETFLARLYAAGAGGHFDALGHHPYSYPRLPGTAAPDDGWWAMVRPGGLRELMTAHGDGSKRIWATEFGAHTLGGAEGGVDESRQAEILDAGWNLWQSYPWSGPLIVYTYQDSALSSPDRERFFGLRRADGTAKPGLAALMRMTRTG